MIGWNTEKIRSAAEEELFLWRADSIKELCEKTSLPFETTQATISDFNQKVDQKVDAEFNREYLKNKISEGPFYALLVHASVLVTFGGLRVNDNLQLINQSGEIINGLYAAGELLGLGATSGSAFCSGMAITPALSFGRILGAQIASK